MEQFLNEIDQFRAKWGFSASAFGQTFAKDPSFLFRLRSGKDCGVRKSDEIRKLMAGHAKARTKEDAA